MQSQDRFSIKIVGESGQGLNSVGNLLTKALINSGSYVFGYREYPSLIKGGHASFQIDISDFPINSSSRYSDVLIVLSRKSFHIYLQSVDKNGRVIHTVPSLIISKEEQAFIDSHQIVIEHIDGIGLSKQVGGSYVTANMVLVGYVWSQLGLNLETLLKAVEEEFADKPQFIEIDKRCVEIGSDEGQHSKLIEHSVSFNAKDQGTIVVSGNESIAFGAIKAGARAFYAYPMTPASSILSTLAKHYHENGMVVKQAEDEITAAQMTLGSMFMGTRAFTATSGGGFDLMTESVSLSGMTETPFVCILAQRPGPATGLPTWTSASDLNLALYGGHGEFPRCVIAASDVESCYRLIQEAFNKAEYYQIPVIVLTEKHIAESLFQIQEFPEDLPIIRGLVEGDQVSKLSSEDRYAITESGISNRWLPGQSEATFVGNSDEHRPDGSITEDAVEAKAMIDKRMRKLLSLAETLPEPQIFGNHDAKNILIGWGGVKSVVLDALLESKNESWKYIHIEFIHPLKHEFFKLLTGNFYSIENNYNSQFSQLLESSCSLTFKKKFNKYDGRPFFIEEVIHILNNNS